MNALWRRSCECLLRASRLLSWQSEILALCKERRLTEALQILYSCKPGSASSPVYSSLLKLCMDLGAKREGRSLHEYLRRHGCRSCIHLDTKFIIFYGKNGDTDSARHLFDDMSERSVVSWTAMISAYSQNGQAEEAFDIFASMRVSGFKANQFTYGSVLRACTNLLCTGRGRQVHGCIAKSRFSRNIFVQSALLDLHAKCGQIEDAWNLFLEMEQKDLISWNSIIGGYVVQGLGDVAVGLFCSMLKDGFQPDCFTFASTLRACGAIQSHVMTNQVHGLVIQLGYEKDDVVIGSMINAYAKCLNMSSARLLYDSMPEKDLVSCTTLITGYSQQKDCSLSALEVFSLVNSMGMKTDDMIACSILNACANISSLSMGKQIHASLLKKLPNYDMAVGNALIDMYAKSGELQDARHVFDEMPLKNVVTWTSMTTAYGYHGYGEDAVALFEKMVHHGLEPNDITFLSLLSACSHAGLINEGWKLFSSMTKEYNILPRAKHYACYIDLLARGGLLEEAYSFVCKMDAKCSPSVWGALLGSCGVHGNVPLGEISAKCLTYLVPSCSASYVVLSNIYASAGLWEDALSVRRCMDTRNIIKNLGSSSTNIMHGMRPFPLVY